MKPFFASLALAFSTSAWAEQVYVVGVEQAHFLPHYSVDEKGDYRGFARELLDSFAASSGVRLSFDSWHAAEESTTSSRWLTWIGSRRKATT